MSMKATFNGEIGAQSMPQPFGYISCLHVTWRRVATDLLDVIELQRRCFAGSALRDGGRGVDGASGSLSFSHSALSVALQISTPTTKQSCLFLFEHILQPFESVSDSLYYGIGSKLNFYFFARVFRARLFST